METLEIIKKRRTIRSFKDRDISKEDLRKILDSGNSAPCAGRIPNNKFVVVDSKDKISKISKFSFNQEWISGAKLLIVVCSEDSVLESTYAERGKMYSIQNSAASVENMLIEATSLEIGSAWIGAFDEDKVKRLLEIPEELSVYSIVALGYASEVPDMTRPSLSGVVYFGKWGEFKYKKKSIKDWISKKFK